MTFIRPGRGKPPEDEWTEIKPLLEKRFDSKTVGEIEEQRDDILDRAYGCRFMGKENLIEELCEMDILLGFLQSDNPRLAARFWDYIGHEVETGLKIGCRIPWQYTFVKKER